LAGDYDNFKGQKKVKGPAGFRDMMKKEKVFKQYYEWAIGRRMADQVDFIRAVNAYKKKPTWASAANIAEVYLNSDPSNQKYVNVDYFELEDWIVRCCQEGQMLPG